MTTADDVPRADLCRNRQSCRPEIGSISKAFEVSYGARFLGYVTTYYIQTIFFFRIRRYTADMVMMDCFKEVKNLC